MPHRHPDPRSLLKRFTLTAMRAMERAVEKAQTARKRTCDIENMVLELCSPPCDEVEALLRHCGLPRQTLADAAAVAVAKQESNSKISRPEFTEELFDWYTTAWHVASLELEATTIRTGHLIVPLLERREYLGRFIAEIQDDWSRKAKAEFNSLLAGSPEASEPHYGA